MCTMIAHQVKIANIGLGNLQPPEINMSELKTTGRTRSGQPISTPGSSLAIST